jgi:V8-like Glu-specific endopeptidase
MPIKTLAFLGERKAPDPLSEVHARRPILGSGKVPKEITSLASEQTFYLHATEDREPQIRVARVRERDRDLWRVAVPVDSVLHGARAGISMQREKPEAVLNAIDEKASFTGFRPEWTDALFVPRAAAPQQERRVMTRFNGRRVTPMWVFGNDDRWQFRDSGWPWGLVGRIFNNRGFTGTGALVGDRIVITAGHMVPWDDSSWWMRFVPAYYDGTSLYGGGVESYVSDARGYDVSNVAGYDWAVLRLYEPLGTQLGYFGYNGYADSWNDQPYWSIIGYPGAIANAMRPSFQGSITVGDTDSDSNGGEELESSTADITPGDSGGPMFGWWGNDPRIVGVVSGEEEYTFLWWTFDQDNIMAAGSGFTSLCAWGRTNWPV